MTEPQRLLFDEFEFHPGSGELFRGGAPVSLQPQPAKVLEALAGRTGEVVTREEIRQLVWGEAFVDFDASLNFCIKQIRRALGDSATIPRYIETIPRRGYRFLRPVRTELAADAAQPGPPPIGIVPIRAPAHNPLTPPGQWTWLAGIAFLLAASVLLVSLVASRFRSPVSGPRLAVFPLACNSADPADLKVCGGVTEALTAEVTRRFQDHLAVIASTSPLVYQGTRRSPPAVGKELGATHLITGKVDISGGQLRIDARLATTDGDVLWRQSFAGDLMDAPGVYEQIVRKVAGTLKLRLPATRTADARPPREASEAYLKGIYLQRLWNHDEAVKSFEEAILLAPRFAPAYAALARSRVEQGRPPHDDAPASQAAARQALQLDPRLPEAHLAMGNVLFKDQVDWDGAGAEYRQALLLSPGSADILHCYANYLVALGRTDEAIAYVTRARELDPASMEISSDYAWYFYIARRYDEAIRQARSTLTLLKLTQDVIPPIAKWGQSWSYFVLVHASLKKGDSETVLSTVKAKMRELGKGEAADRVKSLPQLLEWRRQFIEEDARKNPGRSYGVAMANASVGRIDGTLAALEQQCRNGGESMMFNYVAVEPMFDFVHHDPRFAKIVDCAGVPRTAPARRSLQVAAGGGRGSAVAK
jgi:DNA-binding winged helix-turn-helix (wHTH) protein/TolB-like protein/tetratricopeptide (TPR) repeat protein